MNWDDLRKLVDQWHAAAQKIPGYQDTTINGDGIQLLLMVNRSKEGDLVLKVTAAKDFISLISPSDLFQPNTMDPNAPTIPYASITVTERE